MRLIMHIYTDIAMYVCIYPFTQPRLKHIIMFNVHRWFICQCVHWLNPIQFVCVCVHDYVCMMAMSSIKCHLQSLSLNSLSCRCLLFLVARLWLWLIHIVLASSTLLSNCFSSYLTLVLLFLVRVASCECLPIVVNSPKSFYHNSSLFPHWILFG